MPRGAPDYNVPAYSVAVSSVDNADVIPFNVGFARADGRGRVVFFEDFRGGMNRWQPDFEGGGLSPIHDLSSGHSLGYYGAIKFSPVGVDGGSYLLSTFILPVSRSYGLEFSLYLSNIFPEVLIDLEAANATGQGKGTRIKIEHATGDVYIEVNSAFVKIHDTNVVSNIYGKFVTFKIVMDIETGTYTRLMVGGDEYDLTAYDLGDTNIYLAGTVNVRFYTIGKAAVYFGNVWLGHVIITGDEQ